MKKLTVLLLTVLMLFALCGCRVCRTENEKSAQAAMPADGMLYDYEESAVAAGKYGGFAPNAVMSTMARTAGPEEAPVPEPSGSDGGTKETSADLDPEKIIYSANASLETTEFENTLSALNALIDRLGGWVESSSVSGSDFNTLSRGAKTRRSADYTIRVPNEKFDELMKELPALGNVPYSHVYTENVTAEYYDTETRLKTYEAQEQRLMELLDMAETVSDVIEIENELTEVRYRIESLKTTLRGWDRRVSWSTLYLSVSEVVEYTPQEKQQYGSRLAEALSDGIEELGEFFLDFVEVLPILLLLLAVLVAVILAVKKAVTAGMGKRNGRVSERKRKREEQKAGGTNCTESPQKNE